MKIEIATIDSTGMSTMMQIIDTVHHAELTVVSCKETGVMTVKPDCGNELRVEISLSVEEASDLLLLISHEGWPSKRRSD